MTITMDRPTVITTLTLMPLAHPAMHGIKKWSDQGALHRAVMRLFPDHLAGEPTVRRATAGILFRHDTPTDSPARLLIQHNTAMRADLTINTGIKQVALDSLLTTLTVGRGVRFRIVLNAVRSQTGTKKRVAVTDPDDLLSWGQHRLEIAGLGRIELSVQPTTALGFTAKGPVWTAQYDGYATVHNPALITDAVRQGIGRSKAYGCGLLSLAPIGQ